MLMLSQFGACEKKDRFRVDYQACNAVTRKYAFPMPDIGDLLDQHSGKKVFFTG